MTSTVSAISIARSAGINDHFVAHWSTAFLSAWPIAFPTVLLVTPLVRRVIAPALTERPPPSLRTCTTEQQD
jgi:hypothetical protein